MQVTMIEPFTNKHFEYRSLGDRINDLRQCVNLYPNIPKKKAFANYFSPKVGEYSQIERLYSLDTNSKLHSPLCAEPINPVNGYRRMTVCTRIVNGGSSGPNTPTQLQSPEIPVLLEESDMIS